MAKSVVREPSGSQAPRTPNQQGAAGGNTAPSPSGQADITARVGGSTAGVVSQRGQSVFASSTAPRAAQAKRGKASKASSTAKSKAPAVSEGSATGDPWGAVTTSVNPSLASADSPDSGGLSGGMVAMIALLGLGLAGITGGALATAGRRRRA